MRYFEVCEPAGWRGKDAVPVARFADRRDADRVAAALGEVAGRSATERPDHARPFVRAVVLDDVTEWLAAVPYFLIGAAAAALVVALRRRN